MGAPSARLDFDLVAMGQDAAVVFAGLDTTNLLDGGIYHRSTDSWESIPSPAGYVNQGDTDTYRVWTGNGFYLWGGGLHHEGDPSFHGSSNDGLWLDLSNI